MSQIRKTVSASILIGGMAVSIGSAQQAKPAAEAKPVKTGVKAPGVVRPLSTLVPKTVYPVPGTPDWSVVTKDAVWVSSARVNHLVQLLPATGTVGVTVDIARPCSGLANAFGSIWVPSCGKHVVERLDEATGKVTAEIAADPANSEGGITVGDGAIWMVVKPSTLVRIDPTTNAVVSKLELPSGSENPAFGDGFVWISSFAHDQLLKVDPKTNTIAATIAIGPKPRFLTVGAGSVWTLNQGDGTVSRVDMTTSKLVATIELGIPGEGGEITYGANSVWTTLFDYPLTQIDVKTNKPVKQWAGKGGDGLRFGLGSLWLSNLLQGNVWQITPESE